MKKLLTVCLLAFAAAGATGCRSAAEGVKPKLMWLDCSANWVRFSYPDSIRYYVNKCREAGMTALVLDVKGTSSEVVYPSEHAPQVREWKGFARPDFDFVGTFVEAAHDAGLEIYGSFNTFAEGNGVFRRGLIYDGHPEWQAVNYIPGRGLVPQLEIPEKKVLFANPALPAVQDHEIAIFKEVAQKYDFDGLLLDLAKADVAEALKTLRLDTYVAQLKSLNDAYKALDTTRTDEYAARVKTDTTKARKATDETLDLIIQRVNAYAVLEPTEAINAFIDTVNQIFRKYKNLIAAKGGPTSPSKPDDKPYPTPDPTPDPENPGGDSESPDEI